MILVDLNQVFFSEILLAGNLKDEKDVKFVALSGLGRLLKQFKEFGDVILCSDAKHYWRKEKIFPFYKIHREENRKSSKVDWNLLFSATNQLKEDLKEHFPYKFIEVDGAEADDVIAVLSKEFSEKEKVLIISGDSDFIQLINKNVSIFQPLKKQFISFKQ
jgi:5'-3' exonuclease